jgi:hypothetical protein
MIDRKGRGAERMLGTKTCKVWMYKWGFMITSRADLDLDLPFPRF